MTLWLDMLVMSDQSYSQVGEKMKSWPNRAIDFNFDLKLGQDGWQSDSGQIQTNPGAQEVAYLQDQSELYQQWADSWFFISSN